MGEKEQTFLAAPFFTDVVFLAVGDFRPATTLVFFEGAALGAGAAFLAAGAAVFFAAGIAFFVVAALDAAFLAGAGAAAFFAAPVRAVLVVALPAFFAVALVLCHVSPCDYLVPTHNLPGCRSDRRFFRYGLLCRYGLGRCSLLLRCRFGGRRRFSGCTLGLDRLILRHQYISLYFQI